MRCPLYQVVLPTSDAAQMDHASSPDRRGLPREVKTLD